tara:strand:- start:4254 stop:4670 length:417 start_codon:yes stop_codon:yes gene_type:complete
MQVRDVMSKDPALVTPSTTIKEAAKTMANEKMGFLPVGENDRLQGTLTDRDIVLRATSEGKDAESTHVKEIYSDELFYCNEDQPLEEVAQIMGSQQVRRLPVVNTDKRFVGVISIGDVAQHINPSITGEILKDVTNWA